MDAAFNIALPVFGIIAAGMLAGRFGFMDGADAQVLNKYVFRFAMPAALFGLTASTAPPGLADARLALSYAIAGFTIIFGVYFLSKALFSLSRQEAGAHAFSSTLGNAVFLGLPIALSIEGWARPFVVLMLVEGIFIIAAGAAMMSPKSSDDGLSLLKLGERIFISAFRNPLVAGAAAGMAVSVAGLSLPGPASSFFTILGRAAGPTALFSLGLFLATHKFPAIGAVAGKVSAIAAAKMLALPAIAIGAAYMLGIRDGHALAALSLFTLVPTGVGAFIMASQYKIYTTETAAAVSVTTVLSLLTITGVLMVFT